MSATWNPVSSARLVADVIDNGRVSAQQLLVVGLCLLFNALDGLTSRQWLWSTGRYRLHWRCHRPK